MRRARILEVQVKVVYQEFDKEKNRLVDTKETEVVSGDQMFLSYIGAHCKVEEAIEPKQVVQVEWL